MLISIETHITCDFPGGGGGGGGGGSGPPFPLLIGTWYQKTMFDRYYCIGFFQLKTLEKRFENFI